MVALLIAVVVLVVIVALLLAAGATCAHDLIAQSWIRWYRSLWKRITVELSVERFWYAEKRVVIVDQPCRNAEDGDDDGDDYDSDGGDDDSDEYLFLLQIK